MNVAMLIEELRKLPQDKQVQISVIDRGVRNIYNSCALYSDNRRLLITGVNGVREVWRDIKENY